MQIFLITVAIIEFGLIVAWCYLTYEIKFKHPKKLKRIEDVYNIRLFILKNYPLDKYLNLPPFDEMVESKDPLHIENYV